MDQRIIKDLLSHKARQVQQLYDDFMINASLGSYFFEGPDADKLNAIRCFNNQTRGGLRLDIFPQFKPSLNLAEFLNLMTAPDSFDAQIQGYACDDKTQAVLVSKPPVYVSPVRPCINISFADNSNPDASPYLTFTAPTAGIPNIIHGGNLRFVMKNSREMIVSHYQADIMQLELERLKEIQQKLPDPVVGAIKLYYDTMSWAQLKTMISSGIEFNENLANLYGKYLVDTTDAKTPTRTEIERKEEEAEAKADKKTDNAWLDTKKDVFE